MEVKILPQQLVFTAWDDDPPRNDRSKPRRKASSRPKIEHVALSTGREVVRIRARRTPPTGRRTESQLYVYPYQLNVEDLADAAMTVLPSDAYALLVLTNHDLYESDDDDFCCGRAWGGSRISLVSTARYRPGLDKLHEVDEQHVWPASHCKAFVDKMSCPYDEDISSTVPARPVKKSKNRTAAPAGGIASPTAEPMERALKAHLSENVASDSASSDAHLFRVCRTASHELGHCFGLDHCMYKACAMQGTASVAEDMRQPPYLCPVCERKLEWAVLRVDAGHVVDNTGDISRKNTEAGADDDVGMGSQDCEVEK